MEKNTFDNYKNSIKRIKCIYAYDGSEVDKNTFWDGYIVMQNVDGILNIEGYEIDKMDSLERDGNIHKRYILGSYADGSLLFEVFPGKIAPIHYDMHYNLENGCFYGCWWLSPSKNHPHPFGGCGKAIISIEDVIIDISIEDDIGVIIEEKEAIEIINKVADQYKNEYFEEIDNFLSKKQIPIFDSAPAVMKLSKYSDILRQK